MLTFEATPGGIYGGPNSFAYDHKESLLNTFVRMIDINEKNIADTAFLLLVFNSPGPASITIMEINTDGLENSTSFAPLRDVPVTFRDLKRQTYGELITEYQQAAGFR